MAEDDIVQKIKLEVEGGDKVAEQYKAAGDAAEAAAEQIQKAGEAGGDGFSKTGESAEKAAEGLAKVGEAAEEASDKLGDISGDSFSKLTESITKLGETSKQTFESATTAAQKFGAVGEDLQKLAIAIEQFSTKSDAGGKAFTTLTETVAKTKTTLTEASIAAAQASEGFVKIGEATKGATTQAQAISEKLNDAAKSLKEIAPESEKTAEGLEKMGDASEKAGEGLETINKSAGETAKELQNVSKAANEAAQSTSKFSLETVKTTAIIAKNSAEIIKTGVEIVQLVRRHDSLIESLFKLATAGRAAVTALELIAPALTPIVAGLTAIGVAAAGAILAFEAVERAATGFARKTADLSQSMTKLAQESGYSFDAIQRGKSAFELLGISADSFKKSILSISAEMKKFDVGAAIQKSADEVTKAVEQVKKAEIELLEFQTGGRMRLVIGDIEGEKRLNRLLELYRQTNSEVDKGAKLAEALDAARKKEAEALANNLSTLLPKIIAIQEGMKGVTFDELTKKESIIDALSASMKKAGESGKVAGEELIKFIATVNSLDVARAAGAKFGLTEEDVDLIRRSNGLLGTTHEIIKKIQNAGVLISPASAAAFQKMEDEIKNVGQAWARLNQAWESSILATVAAKISSSLNGIKAELINLAAVALESLNGIANALMESFKRLFEFMLSGWKMVVTQIQETKLGKLFGLGFTEGIDTMNKGLAAAAGGVAKFFGASDEAVQKLRNSVLGYDETQRKAGDTASEMWRKTAEGANNAAEATTKAGTASGEAAKKTESGTKDSAKAFDELATKVQQVAQQTGKSTQQVLDELKNMKPTVSVEHMMEDIRRAAERTVNAIKDLFKIQLAPMQPLDFSAVIDSAKDASEKVKEAFVVNALDWSKLSEGLDAQVESIKQKLQEIGKKTEDAVDPEPVKAATSAVDKFEDAFNETASAVERVSKRTEEFNSLPTEENARKLETAVKALAGMVPEVTALSDAMKETDQGDQIAKNMERLGEAIKDTMRDAAKAIKNFFDEDADRIFVPINASADKSAKRVEDSFNDIRLREFNEKLSFENIVRDAEKAAQDVGQAFSNIRIDSSSMGTIDFSSIISNAQSAATQIATTISQTITQGLASIDFTAILTKIQETFNLIVQAANTTAQGISQAFAAIDFSGLISQINAVTQAFQAMAAAAYEAAAAAASAASAGGGASGGSRFGGLFRGRPGTDTNLTWLTDYEYVMRPEAVMRYGVNFMDMINNMTLPGFRHGGLVMPQLRLPAFAGGGINKVSSSGKADGGGDKRTLHLTIGSQTFKNLSAPEATAKQLERASIGNKASATGIKPHWYK